MSLDALIEAVEAGTLTGEDEYFYPTGIAEMIEGPCPARAWLLSILRAYKQVQA